MLGWRRPRARKGGIVHFIWLQSFEMSSVGAETAVSLLLGDVEATHGWAVIYVVTALACLVGSYVACCGKDGRGSGSGLRPIEHWSASGDGKPAKHRSVHHELRHNWRLLNADETIRGA